MNPDHNFAPNSLKIHSNILPSTPRSWEWCLPFRFSDHTRPSPNPCVTCRNKLFFYGKDLLARRPIPKLKDHPLSDVVYYILLYCEICNSEYYNDNCFVHLLALSCSILSQTLYCYGIQRCISLWTVQMAAVEALWDRSGSSIKWSGEFGLHIRELQLLNERNSAIFTWLLQLTYSAQWIPCYVKNVKRNTKAVIRKVRKQKLK